MISTHTVALWTNEPGPYIRAAAEAGLDSAFELVPAPLAADLPDDLLQRSDVLLGWRPPARLRQRAPRLRWIQALTGGVEGWLASPDLPPDVLLTCARGTHRVQMPENILGALFLITKQLAEIAFDQRERRWSRRVNQLLAGKTLGILGVGAIGLEVARKATALEMRVIGVKRQPTALPPLDRVVGPGDLDVVLSEADFLLLLLPSTVETRGIVDRKTLARMKPTVWVLNFGRGDLIVEADLIEAVRERRIAGAVLDVFPVEPLPPESPLWTTDGIVIFPHVGGLHPERDRVVAELFVENLRRFAAGEALLSLVDRARGY